jgi:hypothetical protein
MEQTAEKRNTLNKNAQYILYWAAASVGLNRRFLRSRVPAVEFYGTKGDSWAYAGIALPLIP